MLKSGIFKKEKKAGGKKLNHNGYLDYEIPLHWIAEEDGDTLTVYDPDGEGAMTASFYNMLADRSIDEQITVMAKKFTEQNAITVDKSMFFIHGGTEKTVLHATDITQDKWFVKLWVAAKKPKIVMITYQSQKKTKEIEICDAIVESMRFSV